jgi:GNAT superfamily N-acetyltransferase
MTLVNDERAATEAIARGPAAAQPRGIRSATPDDAPHMAATLAGAFYDDQVFRWFSPDDARRRAMLPSFFAVFVDAFMSHGEAYVAEDIAGVALWAPPGVEPLSVEPIYLERLEQIAGPDAPRLFQISEIFEAHTPKEPHYHLQFLGVLPERQGAGIGARLMAPGLERRDREGVPAYLEATSDRNRALYERHGFRAHGDIPLPDGPALWRMWRDPVA